VLEDELLVIGGKVGFGILAAERDLADIAEMNFADRAERAVRGAL
jgi:hypothetical protein